MQELKHSVSFGWKNFSLGQKLASLQILLSIFFVGCFFGCLSFFDE